MKKTRIDVFAAVAVVDAKAPYLLDASGVASLRFVNGCCHFQPPICKEREGGRGGTEVVKILITVITLLPGQSPFTQLPSHHEQPCIADVHLLQLCVSSLHLPSAESQQNPLKKRKENKEYK